MPDRESAITHLQIISTWASFARERDLQFFTAKHLEDISQWANDAITLLKEQEPVKPIMRYENDWRCGACQKHVVTRNDLFCSRCGREVKWE